MQEKSNTLKPGGDEKPSRLYLSPPHLSGNELQYVTDAIRSNWIAPVGPDVAAFERALAETAGTKTAVAVSAGTAGIHLCLRVLDVGPGDIVFCSDLTFAGSCNPIVYQNAQPVFIDSEPSTSNMSPEALEQAFDRARREGKKPRAVIAVDLYGQPAKYREIEAVCEAYGVPLIEDAAEALGAFYDGRPCGSIGHFGVFSFNGNKIITTSGGGMVVTDDEEAAARIKYLATQAKQPVYYYEHTEIGYNYRLSNISAALGRAQLEGLPQKIARRKEIYETYRGAFEGLPLAMLPIGEKNTPNFWLSVVALDPDARREPLDIIRALEAENIESRPVWKPMHLQPVYKDCAFFPHPGGCVSERLFACGVCLPSGSGMTPEDQARVIRIVRGCF